jgi:hypothetical protein
MACLVKRAAAFAPFAATLCSLPLLRRGLTRLDTILEDALHIG